MGQGGEHLGRTSPEGHEGNPALVEPVQVGICGELRVNKAFVGSLTGALLPRGDELEHLVVLFGFLQLPLGVAQDPRVGIVRQESQQALLTTAALGNVMLLDKRSLAVERHGMEVEIEGDPMLQAQCARGIVPPAHEHRRTGRVDTATLRSEKGALRHDIEAGTEGQAVVKDRAHDVTVARIAKKFSGEERPHGVSGRDLFRTGQPGLAKELVERERGQRGEEEQHAAKLGAQLARTQSEPPHIRDRRRRGAGRVGAFIVSAAG